VPGNQCVLDNRDLPFGITGGGRFRTGLEKLMVERHLEMAFCFRFIRNECFQQANGRRIGIPVDIFVGVG